MSNRKHKHHHHHHIDESEDFKLRQLRSIRKKKIAKNALFYSLLVIAILVVAAVFWLYTH